MALLASLILQVQAWKNLWCNNRSGGSPAWLPMPDFAELHRQRQVHRHLTQQLLWEEYRQANPDGYRYSRFCELFKRWLPPLGEPVADHRTGQPPAALRPNPPGAAT